MAKAKIDLDDAAARLVSAYRRYGKEAAQNRLDCLVAGGLKVFELAILQDKFKEELRRSESSKPPFSFGLRDLP